MAKKQTAKQIVKEFEHVLIELEYNELFEFAKQNGFDSASGFGAFKKALLEIGIDYNAIRSAKQNEKKEEMRNSITHELTLYSDAKASCRRFGICDAEGQPVWYGLFFENDFDFTGEQSTGEMSAAKKAVYFASKVRESLGKESIKLTLKVDAQWLTWANATQDTDYDGKKLGGKALALAQSANNLGVVLQVVHIPGSENPADAYTTCTGYKKWQDNDLQSLATEIEHVN